MAICVGCGLDINPVSGLLEVQLRPGGGLDCQNLDLPNDGLFVSFPSSSIVTDDSTTIDFTGDGSPGSHLTAVVKKSADNCNALINGSDGGLYVACQDSIVGSSLQTSPQDVGAGQLMTAPGTFSYDNSNSTSSIHICNVTCCTVSGQIEVTVGDTYLEADVNFLGNAHLQIKVDGGAFTDVVPDSQKIFHNVGNATQRMDLDNISTAFPFLIAAGVCVDFQWRLQVVATVGTANLHTLSAGPKFQSRWHLSHVDCCDHA